MREHPFLSIHPTAVAYLITTYLIYIFAVFFWGHSTFEFFYYCCPASVRLSGNVLGCSPRASTECVHPFTVLVQILASSRLPADTSNCEERQSAVMGEIGKGPMQETIYFCIGSFVWFGWLVNNKMVDSSKGKLSHWGGPEVRRVYGLKCYRLLLLLVNEGKQFESGGSTPTSKRERLQSVASYSL